MISKKYRYNHPKMTVIIKANKWLVPVKLKKKIDCEWPNFG